MKLWHKQTVVSPNATQDFQSKVTALCYTRDNKYLAVATQDRLISIYDENGDEVDKFNTKPNNKGPKVSSFFVVEAHQCIFLSFLINFLRKCSRYETNSKGLHRSVDSIRSRNL